MRDKLYKFNRIYFLDNGYGVRGGANFVIQLINYLLDYTNIKVGIIDFIDGYITQNLVGKSIDFIDYASENWDIPDNSIIFVPTERLCLLKNIVNKRNNIKIITILWETRIGWHILYPSNVLKNFTKLLYKTNSLMFLDQGCQIALENQLNHKFSPQYLPLYLPFSQSFETRHIINDKEINIAWLGRLSDSKCFTLLNVMKKFNNLKTEKKKRIHIIGHGLWEENLRRKIIDLNLNSIEIIFLGKLEGDILDEYLINNIDVLFAMGTSLLHGARLTIPSVGVSETLNPNLDLDKFIWLFDEEGFQLGLSDDVSLISSKAKSMQEILNEAFYQKEIIGTKCYMYALEKHCNIKDTINKLLAYSADTKLTYTHIKKLFKRLPFVDYIIKTFYLAKINLLQILKYNKKIFERRISIFGLPFYKKVSQNGIDYYYLFNVLFYKKQSWNKKFNKLNILYKIKCKIIKKEIVGQYSFPNIFDKTLK